MEKLYNAFQQIKCDVCHKNIDYEIWIEHLVNQLMLSKKKKSMLCFIGNGGSAGIAMHMTTDFLKNGGMRTHSMHDATTLTCLGNDFGYEYVFSKQVEMVALSDDVLFAISSSGNSPNIVNAVNQAKEQHCKVITLSGFKENNRIRTLGDYNLYVPSMEYGVVESIHNAVLQQIVDELMERNQAI